MYYILVAGGYMAPVIVPGFYSFYMLALAKLMPYQFSPVVFVQCQKPGRGGGVEGSGTPVFSVGY